MARMIELKTPLGKDLLFRSLRGREGLGRSSEFEVSALSTRKDIKPSDLLGKTITVKLELVKGGFRYFNGYVTRFAQRDTVGRFYEYQMTVHSWLWFLTRTTDCRIFQEKTVPEIIKEVFADHKMAVFEDGLTASYRQREYCVQYRETDFDFVSRLMEEEGIYYYFEHSDGKHTLKLVDSDSGHKKLENKASIAYYPPGRTLHTDEEYIQSGPARPADPAGRGGAHRLRLRASPRPIWARRPRTSSSTTARTTRSTTTPATTSRPTTATTTCACAWTSSTPSSSWPRPSATCATSRWAGSSASPTRRARTRRRTTSS